MALKEEMVPVTSGKKKVRKETVAVSATRPKIVSKNQTTLPPHLLCQPHHESKCVESNHRCILRQPYRYYLRGTCTRTPCEYLHPPECQFYKNETSCNAGDKCLFPHHEVDEQPKKKPKKSGHSPKRKESDDKNAVAIVKSISQLGCVSQDSDAPVSQGRKSRWNPRQKVLEPIQKGTIHKVYAASCEYPGKEWTIVGKNKCQRSSSAKSLCYEIWGQVPRREWKTAAMCPKKGVESCQKHHKLKEKDKAAFFFPAEEWVLPATSTKEPEERELVVDSGASVHMVSKKELGSVELETMRIWRSPTTVTTANGEVQTRHEATVFVKELDLFVTFVLLKETPAVLSLGKLCEDHWYTYHWTSSQKPHFT